MKYIGLLAGKLALFFGNLLNRGSSFPGLVARKISPGILQKIKYPDKIIMVTGTNGKTSTANLLADIIEKSGKKVIHNTRGANMMNGLVTAIIEGTGLGMKMKADVLLLEIDESTIPKFFKLVTPTHLAVTNFFRDQLDRHGEIDTLIKKIMGAVDKEVCLVLNGNDPLVHSLGEGLSENPKIYYGVEETEYSYFDETEVRESKWCPNCNSVLKYKYYHYSQIGNYECDCGFKTPELKYTATDVDLPNKSFKVNGKEYKSNYDNMYFVFNTLGAIALAEEIGIDYESIRDAVCEFKIGDGRMEEFNVGEYRTFLNLVKNPAGLNQSVNHILNQGDESFSVFFAVNNNWADGIDTSWLWDVAFEKFRDSGLDKFICSGMRAYDLAVRLKYAGIDEAKIIVLPEIPEALDFLKSRTDSKPYILSSYTALQDLRKALNSLEENKEKK